MVWLKAKEYVPDAGGCQMNQTMIFPTTSHLEVGRDWSLHGGDGILSLGHRPNGRRPPGRVLPVGCVNEKLKLVDPGSLPERSTEKAWIVRLCPLTVRSEYCNGTSSADSATWGLGNAKPARKLIAMSPATSRALTK